MNPTIDHVANAVRSVSRVWQREQPGVVAPLSYLCPTAERPRSYAFPPPPGTPWENCEYESRPMPIADVRAARESPDLDREGFELWDAPTAVRDFRDEDAIRSIYYREATELALAATGGQRAYVFDHLVRRRAEDLGALNFGRAGSRGQAAANGRIHNDYSERSGLARFERVLPEADLASCRSRFAIVNIWRSISGPVRDTPLALCDARTVSAQDMVVGDVLYPCRTGEICLVLHSPLHRWWYASAMDRHEALVFKQYDTQLSGVSRFTPHAAFDLPDVPADVPRRESIELRCLVVHEPHEGCA